MNEQKNDDNNDDSNQKKIITQTRQSNLAKRPNLKQMSSSMEQSSKRFLHDNVDKSTNDRILRNKVIYFASKNQSQRVLSLIEQDNLNVNTTDYEGRTPLHIACANNNIETVKILIDKGANVNAEDNYGSRPLDDAQLLLPNSKKIVDLLKHKGAKPGSSFGTTARGSGFVLNPYSPIAILLNLVASNDLKAIKSLFESGLASINDSDYENRTAAHIAASEGNIEILKYLVEEKKISLKEKDRWGHTPYDDAIRSNHLKCAEYIEDNGGGVAETKLLKNSSKEELQKLHAKGISERWAIDEKDFVMEKVKFASGMGGDIFKARWRGLNCCGKTCTGMEGNDQILIDLGNEITLMATLRHPNLVMFLGACFTVSPPILFMEYCENGTLEQKLLYARSETTKYNIPKVQRFSYTYELALAMCFLHTNSPTLIHRDLKPSNILLAKHDILKVTDFGLSKFMPKKNKKLGDKFKMTGETGSYRFMAPEVFKHEQYDSSVDVYSFALICFWIWSGVKPFINITNPIDAIKQAAIQQLRPPLHAIEGGKNIQPIRDLIKRCWDHDSTKRPTFAAILNELETLKENPSFLKQKKFICF